MLRVKDSFATFEDGTSRIIQAGTLVRDDDPIAQGREVLFERVAEDGTAEHLPPAAAAEPEPLPPPAKRRAGPRRTA